LLETSPAKLISWVTTSIVRRSTATGTSSVSATVPINGCALVVLKNDNAASISNVTEDYSQVETNTNSVRGVHGSTITAGAFTSTMTGTQSLPLMAAATFAPA